MTARARVFTRAPEDRPPAAPAGVLFWRATRRQCAWIADDPLKVPAAELTVCGAPVKPGKPYCPHHCSIAYVRIATARLERADERTVEMAA